MRTTEETAAYLRHQHDIGSYSWYQKCLMLQRTARGIPAVYSSALAAAEATPEDERVYALQDLKRGMVAYSDDPNDGNPYGHIYFIIGNDNRDQLLTWSNDVRLRGHVDVVSIEYYQRYWGDKFQFGATWLNGYDFSEFDKPPKETRGGLGENYLHAIEDIEKAIRRHEKKGHTRIVKVLSHDLERMKNHYEKLKHHE